MKLGKQVNWEREEHAAGNGGGREGELGKEDSKDLLSVAAIF